MQSAAITKRMEETRKYILNKDNQSYFYERKVAELKKDVISRNPEKSCP